MTEILSIDEYRNLVKNTRKSHQKTSHQGKMNSLEREYSNYLGLLKSSKIIIDYKFEAIRIKLAYRTTYTPDFMIISHDKIEFHEVKGHWEDDARVKIKVAAAQNPWWTFVAVKKSNKNWDFEYINDNDFSS